MTDVFPVTAKCPQYVTADLMSAADAADREVGRDVPVQRSLQTYLAARR